ncbi:MAG: acetyl-CoA carboxylase biotin carboxylase subunit [Peptococcaceae bacterium]|jgi:acetyl-CoA carboxylase biotin carboxylase subunit|nr:acetyl-CoA carboxylase biotin carboxylase subunit [Peptococcaceae bacterium]
MFKKILVANRGEIALRVIQACTELGIDAVVVHTEADRDSLPCRKAAGTVNLGGPKEYLNAAKIVDAAKHCGAEAVHPGYGFLSENAAFAGACLDAGLTFIGPSPEVIKTMGDKVAAKETALRAGVPVIPGSGGAVAGVEEALALAGRMGYPVMIKAAAGGGGRGMRLVGNADELAGAFNAARSESQSCFGDCTLYLERFIRQPRHVEIQLLADGYGNVVHLGERDCSLQRRHQKILEEAPCPVLGEATRREMGEVAVRLARDVGYLGAGTVEFLLDGEGRFYFMEMNTRIQVEHPVTEMVYGIDLVKEQIRVAAGMPMSFGQDDVRIRGAALECRINAEDPAQGFLPNPGTVTTCVPPGGFGVRLDSAVFPGYTISPYYDSMIGKLITWGRDRPEAIARMRRALDDFVVEGVRTTIPFHQKIMRHAGFAAGSYTTGFLAENEAVLCPKPAARPSLVETLLKRYELSINNWVYELEIEGSA